MSQINIKMINMLLTQLWKHRAIYVLLFAEKDASVRACAAADSFLPAVLEGEEVRLMMHLRVKRVLR